MIKPKIQIVANKPKLKVIAKLKNISFIMATSRTFRTIAGQGTYSLSYLSGRSITDFQFGNTPLVPEQYSLTGTDLQILDPPDPTNIPANIYCKITYK